MSEKEWPASALVWAGVDVRTWYAVSLGARDGSKGSAVVGNQAPCQLHLVSTTVWVGALWHGVVLINMSSNMCIKCCSRCNNANVCKNFGHIPTQSIRKATDNMPRATSSRALPDDLSSLTVFILKEELRLRELATTGRKPRLAARLQSVRPVVRSPCIALSPEEPVPCQELASDFSDFLVRCAHTHAHT